MGPVCDIGRRLLVAAEKDGDITEEPNSLVEELQTSIVENQPAGEQRPAERRTRKIGADQ